MLAENQSDQGLKAEDIAVKAECVTKVFRQNADAVHALSKVSFQVLKGKVFTILGANGAGKTTLLKILTTIMRPSSGNIWIDGYNTRTDIRKVREKIGVVSQGTHFDKYLTVWQNLCLHAQLHGMPKADYEARIADLLERMALFSRRNDYMDTFSGGMQRRVALIRSLIHQPSLLFLDEPSTGLDPSARQDIWQSIQNLKEQTTVILTTHYMDEADRLSDEIMMLDKGEVVLQGTPQALKKHVSHPNLYELSLQTPTALQYKKRLEHVSNQIEVVSDFSLNITLSAEEKALSNNLQQVIQSVESHDFQSFGLAQVDLETVYLTVAERTISVSGTAGSQEKRVIA